MGLPPAVSGEWLQANLDNPGIQVIENAWIPDSYGKAHIPGAIDWPAHPHLKRFTADGERTQHVLTSGEFADLCEALGLRSDRHIVVYDDWHGLFAARLRAVCRYYGVDNVSILDGSWHGWVAEGRPITTRPTLPVPGTDLVPHCRPELFIGWEELARIHGEAGIQVWDTRRVAEFTGEEETGNRRRGHVPGAHHLLWSDLLTGADEPAGEPRYLRPREELTGLLAGIGLRADRTVVTYCQSGIRAAFSQLVLELAGYPVTRLYDASMGEWANLPDTPLTRVSPAGPSPASDPT